MMKQSPSKKTSRLRRMLITSRDFLMNIVAPRSCFVCDRSGDYLCARHKKNLIKHPELCYICHRPTSNSTVCFEHVPGPLLGIIATFVYSRLIKGMVRSIKYEGAHDILSFFAQQCMYDVLSNSYLRQAVQNHSLLITSVPMYHHKQHYERGYNQSEIFAQHLASFSDLPYVPLLTKTTSTQSQASLGRTQRLTNVYKAFQPIGKIISPGVRTVLIVDDVLTTGSTLQECARVLRDTYPDVCVRGLCIARHDA